MDTFYHNLDVSISETRRFQSRQRLRTAQASYAVCSVLYSSLRVEGPCPSPGCHERQLSETIPLERIRPTQHLRLVCTGEKTIKRREDQAISLCSPLPWDCGRRPGALLWGIPWFPGAAIVETNRLSTATTNYGHSRSTYRVD